MTNVAERQPVVDTPNQLEAARLVDIEKIIRAGIKTFAAVGEALTEIHDHRLYRATGKIFDDYTERVRDFSRQRAQQLIGGAEVVQKLGAVGLDVSTEREAQQAVVQYLKTATGSKWPTTSQVEAAVEVVHAIDLHDTVMQTDTGPEVPQAALTGEQRVATLAENVSTGRHERMMCQKMHQQEAMLDAKSNGRGGWRDWCTDKGRDLPEGQEIQIVARLDGRRGAAVFVRIVQSVTIPTLACRETAGWLRAATLAFIREHGQ